MTDRVRTVVANVILKSASGKSVVQAGAEITPKNVKEFLPKKETIKEAVGQLKGMGFKVDLVADTHISVSGRRELFEEVFQVRLVEKTAPIFEPEKAMRRGYRQRYYLSTIPPKIPTKLSRFIETVQFPGPIIYFSSPSPPALTYDHLEVPDDVSRDMDAVKAHLRNITGAAISIAMVDSGFMTPHHPYYVNRGYNIQPLVVDPNDPSPNVDERGHGTGIAACALAVAPGITFIPTKIYNNPAGSFARAVQQNPNIITCSWGTAFDNALQLAINNAVANGIVVLFACGNQGIIGWPGSEPAVISVGGAFMRDNDTVEASNYASSGTNPNNPGRQVPDLCGLCGMAPHGIYIALPTQPGSSYDNTFSGGVYPNGDETASNDGWLVGSGTSSAAPMVAGVAALLMQSDPALVGNPAAVRLALSNSCIDVTTGSSANNEAAGAGQDLATGAGLVQAYRAVNATDIWIRDNPDNDVGLVPTHNRRPTWPPFAHWVSPDIKVFSTTLTNPSADFDPTPETSPIFGQNNYIYVRIRNRGIQPTGAVSVRLYYADPSTNLIFPTDWNDGQSGISGQGTMTVAGAGTNLQTISSVAPNAQVVLSQPFVWQPPNPTAATETQTLPDGRTIGHFCLLARLETTDDPITFPAGTQGSVINDNNIGMKNVGVYSGPPGGMFALAFALSAATKKERPAKNDIVFDLSKLPKKSRVLLQIEQKHLREARLVRARSSKLGVLMIPQRKPVGIYGLALKPKEKIQMKLLVKFQRGVDRGDYSVPILQMSDGRPVGGATLVARVTK